MKYTIIGFDTNDLIEIYDTIIAKSPEEALSLSRENWPSANQVIMAIFKGEPENLYDPEIDIVNDEDYEDETDDDSYHEQYGDDNESESDDE